MSNPEVVQLKSLFGGGGFCAKVICIPAFGAVPFCMAAGRLALIPEVPF
jgi:hypothetical protein